MVTGALLFSDEYEADVAVASAALQDAQRRGSVLPFATGSFCRAWPLLHLGRLGETLADVQQALDARRYCWKLYIGMAHNVAQ